MCVYIDKLMHIRMSAILMVVLCFLCYLQLLKRFFTGSVLISITYQSFVTMAPVGQDKWSVNFSFGEKQESDLMPRAYWGKFTLSCQDLNGVFHRALPK